MSELLAILYLIRKLMRSGDLIGTLLALNPLEQLGLTALVVAGIALAAMLMS